MLNFACGSRITSGVFQASCTFVRTNFVSPSKVTLPTYKVGDSLPRNSVKRLDNMDNKTKRLWVRLSPEEERLFKEKASKYHSVSAMVRDAVRQFNDIATVGKIDALNDMVSLYKKYQQELSWLGGNFNQAMKRANELAIGGMLDKLYYERVILPQCNKILDCLEDIKREQHAIAKKIVKL